jgi:uncharacterized OB-fold protein
VTPSPDPLEFNRCDACQSRFLPADGGACPKCGSTEVRSYFAPGLGTVLAATELAYPSEGWQAPHRLALVEMPESVRLIAIVDGPLPSTRALVSVQRAGAVYRARTEPDP